MNVKSLLSISIALCLLLVGCESTRRTRESVMDTWMGSHIDSLTYKMGAPTTKIQRSNGGYVYTWITYGQAQCNQSYVTDADGIVVSWSYNGCTKYVDVVY